MIPSGCRYGEQLPLMQNWNFGHAFPHPPQWLVSLSTSTHAPPQSFVSGPHLHAPP